MTDEELHGRLNGLKSETAEALKGWEFGPDLQRRVLGRIAQGEALPERAPVAVKRRRPASPWLGWASAAAAVLALAIVAPGLLHGPSGSKQEAASTGSAAPAAKPAADQPAEVAVTASEFKEPSPTGEAGVLQGQSAEQKSMASSAAGTEVAAEKSAGPAALVGAQPQGDTAKIGAPIPLPDPTVMAALSDPAVPPAAPDPAAPPPTTVAPFEGGYLFSLPEGWMYETHLLSPLGVRAVIVARRDQQLAFWVVDSGLGLLTSGAAEGPLQKLTWQGEAELVLTTSEPLTIALP